MVFATTLTLLTLASSPDLTAGRAAFSSLQYAKAAELLTKVTNDPAASPSEQLEADELLARAQLALGHLDLAHAAFTHLLTANPMAAEPAGAPSVRAAFQRAKQALFPPRFIRLRQRETPNDVLEVEIINPWRLSLVAELWQAGGEAAFERHLHPVVGDRFITALGPGARAFVRIVGADGGLLASLGSENAALLGPPALVVDAPKAVPVVTLTPTVVPSAPPTVSTRPVLAVVTGGVGLAMLVVGSVLIGTAIGEQALADGWPLNGATLQEATLARQQAQPTLIGGIVTASVGLVVAVLGSVWWFLLSR